MQDAIKMRPFPLENAKIKLLTKTACNHQVENASIV